MYDLPIKIKYFVGVNASGITAIAGPVVFCAVVYSVKTEPTFAIDDEKDEILSISDYGPWIKKSKRQSRLLKDQILIAAKSTVIITSTAREINDNLLSPIMIQGVRKTVSRAIERIDGATPENVGVELASSLLVWNYDLPFITITGDSWRTCAAHLLSKIQHDQEMLSVHEAYPQYEFDKNKGVVTQNHTKALQELGPCSEHRIVLESVYKYKKDKEPGMDV